MLDALHRALLAIEGVVEGRSAFADKAAYWVNGKEIAHAHGQELDLRLGRKEISARRAMLRADRRVTFRRGSSDWIEIQIREEADVAFVIPLAEAAAAQHRAAPGATPKPPPEGKDLERRRRFH